MYDEMGQVGNSRGERMPNEVHTRSEKSQNEPAALEIYSASVVQNILRCVLVKNEKAELYRTGSTEGKDFMVRNPSTSIEVHTVKHMSSTSAPAPSETYELGPSTPTSHAHHLGVRFDDKPMHRTLE